MTALVQPTHDSLLAKLARVLSPSWGWCGRCGIPWRFVAPHTVHYDLANGVFALCEPCWGCLTPSERLPYYWLRVNVEWLKPELWQEVEQAMLVGEWALDEHLHGYRRAS